ncbi:MAG: hypothetical protein ACXACG_04930 [Candidatus Thorarchaeota archaeon]
MKTKKLFSSLVVLGFIVTVLFASQSVIALSDGITLMASETTDTITIDGETLESAWNDAEALIIPSIEGSGIDVVLKALADDTNIYVFAAWNDSTMDNTRKGWAYNGTHWENVGGNEALMCGTGRHLVQPWVVGLMTSIGMVQVDNLMPKPLGDIQITQ